MTVYVLIILIIAALLAGSNVLTFQRFNVLTICVVLALAVHIMGVGLGGTVGPKVEWLGKPLYGSDGLSAGLGGWALLVGALVLWTGVGKREAGEGPDRKLAVGTLVVAILYSLVYTLDLRLFAVQVLVLAALACVLCDDFRAANSPLFSLALGAVALLAAVLLIGGTTGGEYTIAELPVPALAGWPLVLLALFVGLWAGCAPFTGWSTRGYSGAPAQLAQSLLVVIPVTVLLLRLEGTVDAQLVGAAPESWQTFTSALAWMGGLTAWVAGAGMVVMAGTNKWGQMLTAHTMGLSVWALGLDTELGRYAALAILIAFGVGRVTLDLVVGAKPSARMAASLAAASLGAAPLTAGFVGVWLLAAALGSVGTFERWNVGTLLWLVGAVIIAACGTALHFARIGGSRPTTDDGRWTMDDGRWVGGLRFGVSLIGCAALIAVGTVPGLWMPLLAQMLGVQSGAEPISATWVGIEVNGGSMTLPTLPLALGAVVLLGAAWLMRQWAVRGAKQTTTLLPTAHKRLEKIERDDRSEGAASDEGSGTSTGRPQGEQGRHRGLPLQPAPLAVWRLSLLGLESRLQRLGGLLLAWSARAGSASGALEGRYYLPLALALALVAVLALTR